MRLPILAHLLLILLPAMAGAQDRTVVHLFHYGGTANDDAKAAFEEFRYAIAEKLPRLASELQSLERQMAVLDELLVEPVLEDDKVTLAQPTERIASRAMRKRYWFDTGALALMTGRVKRKNGGLVIRSSFFLGDLGLRNGHETIDVELPYTAQAYETTSDGHSVAVLYALASDLAIDCANRAEAFYLLSQADLRAESIVDEDAELANFLGEIVKAALTEVSERCTG